MAQGGQPGAEPFAAQMDDRILQVQVVQVHAVQLRFMSDELLERNRFV
jgi:hypothetical protein